MDFAEFIYVDKFRTKKSDQRPFERLPKLS